MTYSSIAALGEALDKNVSRVIVGKKKETEFDRFMIRLSLSSPTAKESVSMLELFIANQLLEPLFPAPSSRQPLSATTPRCWR